jgi:hypothetical protein
MGLNIRVHDDLLFPGFANFTAACEPMVASTVLSPLEQKLATDPLEILREILGSDESWDARG